MNIYDYAVSGAMCDTLFSPTNRNGILQDQIPAFLADNAWTDNAANKPALYNPVNETVYAIWIGTNDIGYAGFLAEEQPRGMPLTNFSGCVYDQMDTLHKAGARAFVLINLGPLHLTPLYASLENHGLGSSRFWEDKSSYDANITRTSEKMRQYSTTLNSLFDYQTPYEVKLAERFPDSAFAVFDTFSLVRTLTLSCLRNSRCST